MKWIKTYKKFETIGYTELTNEIWEDISDILIELEDEGFRVTKEIEDVKKIENKLCGDVIEVTIDRYTEKFSFSRIEEQVRRLIDYMLSKDWNYSLMVHIGYAYHSFELGGSHELAKVEKSFRSGSERDLHKSLVSKATKDTSSIRISFYKDINRLIN